MQVNPGGVFIQKFRAEEGVDALDGWHPQNKIDTRLWTDGLGSLEEPVLMFHSDGTIFHTNSAALAFYGVEEADLLGMHCYEMVRRFGLRFSECPYEKVLSTGKPESGMIQYKDVWHKHRVVPVSGDGGEIEGLISVIQDGDDHARLMMASEQLNYLLAATKNAVLIAGIDKKIMRWNHGVSNLFGYQVQDLEDMLIYDIVPLTFRNVFVTYVDQVMDNAYIQEFFMPCLTKDGEVRDVSASIAPLHEPDGTVSGMIMLTRDVTREHDVDMRLVQHLSDTTLQISGPLSHMRTNLEETVLALQDGLLTTEELVMFLTVLMTSIGNIEQSLSQMNSLAIKDIDSIPEEFRRYLAQ